MNKERNTVFDTDFVSVFGTKIATLYKEAIEYQQVLPDVSLTRFRQILELWCTELARKNNLYGTDDLTLRDFIDFLYSERIFSRTVKDNLHKVRQLANNAVHANKELPHDSQRNELISSFVQARSLFSSLLTDLSEPLLSSTTNVVIIDGELKIVEEKEMIYKAFFSDNAKDKFLGGKAISALHDAYFQKLPTTFVTERQNIHLSSHDEIALQLYLAAIELDAELDKVSVNLWCNKKEREELVHSRARPEYNYEFALLVADRPDDDPYKQRAFTALRSAARKNHQPSQALLGALLYNSGAYVESFNLLRPASLDGDLLALRQLYFYYSEGKACDKDMLLATEYAEKAIELGCTQTMYAYGRDLFEGNNVGLDKIKGSEVIKKAADMGDKQATTYSQMLIENDLPKILADGFSNILDIFNKRFLTGSGFVDFEDGRKIGVNDKCPCGSGKKYKKCCKI
ncbi:SEC-C metal-binding domain-containing protein [Aeromonas sp. MR7]|uniref:SEC-C metal-binding domain-containing protein n=1 Tax=Aeromonas sp. MR7 TaxID=2923419 RepID=UPI001F4A6364|nr:SEC-C metal-binding domain-containing protein [Aeromonas sp. MR7]MCH7347771.1 SEC-C domain-containing protein [Aeromonas sp. MR7]